MKTVCTPCQKPFVDDLTCSVSDEWIICKSYGTFYGAPLGFVTDGGVCLAVHSLWVQRGCICLCLGCFFSKTAYLFLCRPRPSNVHAGAGYGFSTLRHGFFFKFLSRFMNRLLPQVMAYLPFTVVCTLWFSLCKVRVSRGTSPSPTFLLCPPAPVKKNSQQEAVSVEAD